MDFFTFTCRAKKLSKSSENIEARLTNHSSSAVSNGHSLSRASDRCVHFTNLLPGDNNGIATMKSSHSESAIQAFTANVTSSTPSLAMCSGMTAIPSQMTAATISFKRDLVLSPLSKIAKGVQTFGQTVKVGVAAAGEGVRSYSARSHPIPSDMDEEYNKMKEMRRACLTRIIEL